VANEYIALAELKSMRRIEDNADDGLLQTRITRASRAIDDRTGRRFWLDGAPSTRTFRTAGRVTYADDGYLLLVDDIGSDDGLVVESGPDGTSWAAVTSYDLDPENAIARGKAVTGLYLAAGWPARVRITARWGWPEIPEAIKEATVLLSNRRFMRRDSPEGVAGWANDGAVRVSRFDPDIEDLVSPFVIPGFA
jgi:hypothetical protein